MPTNIPLAREKLKTALSLSEDLEVRILIQEALSVMTRRPRAQPRTIARKVTSETVRQVNRIIAAQPYLTDLEVALIVDVNPGRVSEIRNKLRTEEKPGMGHDGFNRELARRQGMLDDDG